MAETIAVWTLDSSKLLREPVRISEIARSTGRWHHQIHVGGRATAYAHSRPLGGDPDSWSVTSVVESGIAEKLAGAMTWIDQNIQGDSEVRLLSVPAFQVTALWIVGDPDGVVAIDWPTEYRFEGERVYTAEEFIRVLRQSRHIDGLTD